MSIGRLAARKVAAQSGLDLRVARLEALNHRSGTAPVSPAPSDEQIRGVVARLGPDQTLHDLARGEPVHSQQAPLVVLQPQLEREAQTTGLAPQPVSPAA